MLIGVVHVLRLPAYGPMYIVFRLLPLMVVWVLLFWFCLAFFGFACLAACACTFTSCLLHWRLRSPCRARLQKKIVGFVFHSSPPETPRFIHLGVKCKDGSKSPDWGQVWPSWALFEVSGVLLEAKLGDLEGKLGYREVVFKAELRYFVRPFCCFCSQKCLLPAGSRF